jgi:hypothetical protein
VVSAQNYAHSAKSRQREESREDYEDTQNGSPSISRAEVCLQELPDRVRDEQIIHRAQNTYEE